MVFVVVYIALPSKAITVSTLPTLLVHAYILANLPTKVSPKNLFAVPLFFSSLGFGGGGVYTKGSGGDT